MQVIGQVFLGIITALPQTDIAVIEPRTGFLHDIKLAAEIENFAEAGVRLDTLSNYNTMIEMAIEQGYVHADELETLKEWRRDPASWKK